MPYGKTRRETTKMTLMASQPFLEILLQFHQILNLFDPLSKLQHVYYFDMFTILCP